MKLERPTSIAEKENADLIDRNKQVASNTWKERGKCCNILNNFGDKTLVRIITVIITTMNYKWNFGLCPFKVVVVIIVIFLKSQGVYVISFG